jgi:hypothetical protein
MQDLTPKQTIAVSVLLLGKSIEQAAQDASVDPATIHRWFRDSDAFNTALAEGRRAALHTAVNTLSYTSRKAAVVVDEILDNKRTPPSIRLRAALGILELLMKWAELQDFDARLKRLEAKGGTDAEPDEAA